MSFNTKSTFKVYIVQARLVTTHFSLTPSPSIKGEGLKVKKWRQKALEPSQTYSLIWLQGNVRNKNCSGPPRELAWGLLPPRQFSSCPDDFQKRNVWVSHSDSSIHSLCLTPGKIKDRSVTASNCSNTQWYSFHSSAMLGKFRISLLDKFCWRREGGRDGLNAITISSCSFPSSLTPLGFLRSSSQSSPLLLWVSGTLHITMFTLKMGKKVHKKWNDLPKLT